MREFHVWLWPEHHWYVAQCVEVDVASQGGSEDEAIANIREALTLHFSAPVRSAQQAYAAVADPAAAHVAVPGCVKRVVVELADA